MADVAALGVVAHRPHPDDFPHDRGIDRRVGAFADDLQTNLAVGRALHLDHGLIERDVHLSHRRYSSHERQASMLHGDLADVPQGVAPRA